MRRPLLSLALVAIALGGCNREREQAPVFVQHDPSPLPEAPPRAGSPPTSLTVYDVNEIENVDLSELEFLDLALSEDDASTRPGGRPERSSELRCQSADLHALAERAPKVETLRVSGCEAAIHAGLSAFPDLERLELSDLTFDGLILARVLGLERLQHLGMTRVELGAEPVDALRRLDLRSLSLRHLDKDSLLGDLLGDFPRLEAVELEGEWAGHRAMVSLSKAQRLRSLTLTRTSVGNFSLNQIKGLEKLETVDWSGSTFNNNSPLYLRDLPVKRFRCNCARFGDQGLKHLKLVPGLERIVLVSTDATSEGLVFLQELEQLRELVLESIDLDAAGIEALAQIETLRSLDASGFELSDPTTPNLEKLDQLTHLRLGFPNLANEGAARIASLDRLESLDLANTQISDDGIVEYANLSELRTLTLHHTRITNRGLEAIGSLERLERLELDHTDIVDDGVRHLEAMASLKDLRLDSTLVTDACVPSLLAIPDLQRLNLANTVITSKGAKALSTHPSLETLNLSNTRARP